MVTVILATPVSSTKKNSYRHKIRSSYSSIGIPKSLQHQKQIRKTIQQLLLVYKTNLQIAPAPASAASTALKNDSVNPSTSYCLSTNRIRESLQRVWKSLLQLQPVYKTNPRIALLASTACLQTESANCSNEPLNHFSCVLLPRGALL